MSPEDKRVLDLDSLEREGRPEALAVKIGGREYLLADPKEYDWRDILAAQQAFAQGDPATAIRLLVPEAERDAFFSNPLPAWKLEKLFGEYNTHFGLGSPGEPSASPA